MIASVVHPLSTPSIPFLPFFFIQHLFPLQESVLQTVSRVFLPIKLCSGLFTFFLSICWPFPWFTCHHWWDCHCDVDHKNLQCSRLVLLFSHFWGFCLKLVIIEGICSLRRANYSSVALKFFKWVSKVGEIIGNIHLSWWRPGQTWSVPQVVSFQVSAKSGFLVKYRREETI